MVRRVIAPENRPSERTACASGPRKIEGTAMTQPDSPAEPRKRASPRAPEEDPVARWMAIGLMVIILAGAAILMIGAAMG
jgi:hypothetical protein